MPRIGCAAQSPLVDLMARPLRRLRILRSRRHLILSDLRRDAGSARGLLYRLRHAGGRGCRPMSGLSATAVPVLCCGRCFGLRGRADLGDLALQARWAPPPVGAFGRVPHTHDRAAVAASRPGLSRTTPSQTPDDPRVQPGPRASAPCPAPASESRSRQAGLRPPRQSHRYASLGPRLAHGSGACRSRGFRGLAAIRRHRKRGPGGGRRDDVGGNLR